jgi:hypothetical protein
LFLSLSLSGAELRNFLAAAGAGTTVRSV